MENEEIFFYNFRDENLPDLNVKIYVMSKEIYFNYVRNKVKNDFK